MEQLASIEEILEILPHPNADKLEIARVLGWDVVIKKEQFKVGDKCVYVRTDTIVDTSRPCFAFLAERGGRIRLVKFRGEMSYGLCMPMSDFPDLQAEIGEDIAAQIGVEKYVKTEAEIREAEGLFPSDIISKTDETRLQAFPKVLESLKEKDFYICIKADGSSITIIVNDDGMRVCSRNLELAESENKFWSTAKKYDFQKGYVYQGELVGPGVQGNKMGYSVLKILVFNVKNMLTGEFLNYPELFEHCKAHGLDHVPVIEERPAEFTVKSFVDFASGLTYPNGSPAEGMVVRTCDNNYKQYRMPLALSFKVISEKFCLKYGE